MIPWRYMDWEYRMAVAFADNDGELMRDDVVNAGGQCFYTSTWFRLRAAGFVVERTEREALRGPQDSTRQRYYRLLSLPPYMLEKVSLQAGGLPC